MLAKLSVDKALVKAKSHVKKKEVIEAKKLYGLILQTFPKNLRAQQGLAALNKPNQNNTLQIAPQETVDQLVNLYNQGQFSAVIEQAQDLTKQYPNTFVVWNILGVSSAQIGKLDEALEAYNKSIALKPDFPEAYNNMCVVLNDQGKLYEAIETCKKAISLKPNYADAFSNMGLILKDQEKLDEAIEAYNKSIALKPDYAYAHKNLSLTLIICGKLKEGLDKYEWRWRTREFLSQQRHFSKPLCDEIKSLNGKRILLWCEQGIGDTLNWSSYVSLVASQAEHCILECQEKLVPLLERSFPNVEVKAVNKSCDSKRDDFDFHLPMGSLYKHFIREIEQNAKS